jgi:tetratricopeptide (TPR) repeat protein
MNTCLSAIGIGVLAAAALLPQNADFGANSRIRGEIYPMPAGAGSLMVELSGNGAVPSNSTRVDPDGRFELRAVPPGSYELRVVTAGGLIVHQEMVMLTGPSQSVSIRLSDPAPGNRSANGTVSMRQLSHKVPPAARKAFEKGEQAESKGKLKDAADFYRQAVSIDPEYADAFNELGATEAKQGNLPHALEAFQKAVEVVPDHGLALSNVSIVLAKLRRFEEASEAARRALRVMPGSATLQFVLATSLLLSSGDSDEVLENLERSAGEVPRAHLVAAQLLVRRGKRDEATRHVQDYLRTAPADDREREHARELLDELRP